MKKSELINFIQQHIDANGDGHFLDFKLTDLQGIHEIRSMVYADKREVDPRPMGLQEYLKVMHTKTKVEQDDIFKNKMLFKHTS